MKKEEIQRDTLLLKLLKTPPQPRPKRERGEKKSKPKTSRRGKGGHRKERLPEG